MSQNKILAIILTFLVLILLALAWYTYENKFSFLDGNISLTAGNDYQKNSDFSKSSNDFSKSKTETGNSGTEVTSVLNGEIVIGDPQAPVTMVEYGKYSCSHCSDFQKEALPRIKENYIDTGKVKLVTRRVSPKVLSLFALCGANQNKFEAVDGYLFSNVSDFYSQVIGLKDKEKAKQVFSEWVLEMVNQTGLDPKQFQDCLNSKEEQNKVTHWLEEFESKDTRGTPTFFINGEKVSGNRNYSHFEKIINQALRQP